MSRLLAQLMNELESVEAYAHILMGLLDALQHWLLAYPAQWTLKYNHFVAK